MLFKSVHIIHRDKKSKKEVYLKTRGEVYKGIYHPEKLPATVGLIGFILAFTMLSLKVAILPFSGTLNYQREAEILVVEESGEGMTNKEERSETVGPDDWSCNGRRDPLLLVCLVTLSGCSTAPSVSANLRGYRAHQG